MSDKPTVERVDRERAAALVYAHGIEWTSRPWACWWVEHGLFTTEALTVTAECLTGMAEAFAAHSRDAVKAERERVAAFVEAAAINLCAPPVRVLSDNGAEVVAEVPSMREMSEAVDRHPVGSELRRIARELRAGGPR